MANQQLSAERLWSTFFGPEVAYNPNEIPLVVSLCYYASTMVLGRLLRSVNHAITPKPYQQYVSDMILTFQVCACSLENIMIRNSYGVGGYALILFALSVWFSLTVKEGIGNACANVVDYVLGKQGIKKTILRTVLQLIAGLLSYRYAQGFWYLGLTAGHGRRFRKAHCTAALSVPSPIGMGLETGATFLEAILAMSAFTPFYVSETMSKAVVSVTMTCLGVHMTGMYLNPVNAFNQEFGCHGVSAPEHFLVYWIGPMAAAAVAAVLHRHLRELLKLQRAPPTKTQNSNGKSHHTNDHQDNSPPKTRSSNRNRFYNDSTKRASSSPKKSAGKKTSRKEKTS